MQFIATHREAVQQTNGIPPVFCWTKMGSEAGQSLSDIIRRKDLERECGEGVFAWGIGNSVGPAIKHAILSKQVPVLEALFTPMKAAPKVIDTAPSSIVMWLGYIADSGETTPLPDHMLITSRGHSGAGERKRGHYALICSSTDSLALQHTRDAIDHHAVCNLVSSNPVGASQVTSVVRYRSSESCEASYPVLFRAKLTGQAFVRLAVPVTLTRELFEIYQDVCISQDPKEWHARVSGLRAAVGVDWPIATQTGLFA